MKNVLNLAFPRAAKLFAAIFIMGKCGALNHRFIVLEDDAGSKTHICLPISLSSANNLFFTSCPRPFRQNAIIAIPNNW